MSIAAHPKIAERAMEARFTFADASRIIGDTASKFSRWTRGRQREYRGEVVFDPPLISPDGEHPPLSFLNLIELRFLSSWRQEMSLPAIRLALDYAADELGAKRPLLELDFKRHGKGICAPVSSSTKASQPGAAAFSVVVELYHAEFAEAAKRRSQAA